MASPPRKPSAPQAKAIVAPPPESPDLLHVLVAQSVLTAEQAERVRRATRVNSLSAEHAVVQLGLANEVQVAQALAAHAGLPYVKINPLDLDLDVVTKALSGPFARKHGMVAISKSADRITIAVHDPFAPFPEEDVKRVTGLDVERVVATRSDVETINKGFYDLQASLKTAEKQLTSSRVSTVDLGNQEFLSAEATELDPSAAPVIKALDHILSYAFEQRASDIHFEPKRNLTLVRLRIDGILHDVHLIPKIVYNAVLSRIKILSGCNLAEKRRPQDGRIKREQNGREVELRVSTMPTAFGEKVVLRIFDPDILLKGIDQLGLAAHDLPRFYDFISRPTGIILVTGPTGSGKTTTLYSILKYLSKPDVNIVTIEDPIEMVFEDFNQVAVRPQIEITFGSALRTVLRQDPDVIMVGEIRDGETAENAVQAALTGHLVLSTLHTNDAPSSITRLLDLGIPHFLITSTLIGILAQRLVRENCSHCVEEYVPTPEETAVLRMDPEKLKVYRFKRGKGCLHCRDTGYTGRTGIFEVLPMSEKIRRLVTGQSGSLEIFKVGREEGMRTLREAAIEKVFRGITTTTEMVRVTGK
ncbi:MAG: Flp pilus assembly complex ATPase component TadA [Acidobacteria bacterium]|nr:Flp pilus assembly complex ATPase component TadA [Acidobacteriota bacterium]